MARSCRGVSIVSRPRWTVIQPSPFATDCLPQDGRSLTVALKDDRRGPTNVGSRGPHRHAYHELIWNRRGSGHHLIDGRPHAIRPGTLTIIGRGQIHVLERGMGLSGAIVRFADELLSDCAPVPALPACLLEADSSRTISVPGGDQPQLESLLRMLAVESRRPIDGFSLELQSHLLSSLLLWLQRWHEASGVDSGSQTPAVHLYRGFLRLLERDFARHHDAGHCQSCCGSPPPLCHARWRT